jgi:hypothetical protein
MLAQAHNHLSTTRTASATGRPPPPSRATAARRATPCAITTPEPTPAVTATEPNSRLTTRKHSSNTSSRSERPMARSRGRRQDAGAPYPSGIVSADGRCRGYARTEGPAKFPPRLEGDSRRSVRGRGPRQDRRARPQRLAPVRGGLWPTRASALPWRFEKKRKAMSIGVPLVRRSGEARSFRERGARRCDFW